MLTMHLIPMGIGALLGLTGRTTSSAASQTVEVVGLLGFALGVVLVGYVLFGEGTSELSAASALFLVYGGMIFVPYLVAALLLIWGGWSFVRVVRRKI